ncbi:hypothetical protein PG996_012663 [Apiospora saccharicola]|uniref:Uncharacterized protein n=1 Tax=Apiospora saccharicola TaxID=335842 RepID=A0ABR1U3U2_9PEZI
MMQGQWGHIARQRDAWTYDPLDAHEDPPGARFEPIPPPPGYPALDFRPRMLKRGVLCIMGIIHACVVALLVVLLMRSGDDRAFISHNVNWYMTARYGPSVLGTLTTALVRTTVRDLQRMYPYIKMADDGSGGRSGGRASRTISFPFWPGPVFMGDWFSSGLIFTSFASLQVAFKANLVQIRDLQPGWIVKFDPTITYILLVMYGIQVIFFFSITKWLWSRETGIRSGWDPTNLADTIALFSHFNVPVAAITPSLTRSKAARFLDNHSFRLGYWEVTRPNTKSVFVYGIRSVDPHRQRTVNLADIKSHGRHRPETPYNQTPMLDIMACTFRGMCGAICLVGLVYIAVSGLISRQFLIQDGIFTDVTNTFKFTNSNLTSDLAPNQKLSAQSASGDEISSNLIIWSIILRSLPMFVIGLAVSQLAIYDYHYRWSQPLLNMYQGPAVADRTLLLDYMTPSTLGVLARAWEHGEWKVFYYSLLNALIPLLRLLPVGVLNMVDIKSGALCEFSPEFLYATIIMLAVVLASQASAWCRRKRLFPRGGTSLLDIWLLCFRSRLVQNPEFSECGPSWTKEDLSSTLRLRHDKYLLGAISEQDDGDDNRMGFDIAEVRRESFWTRFVSYVDPSTHQLSHCRCCIDENGEHGNCEADEKQVLLHNYYAAREEPINMRRMFEEEFEQRYFERTGRRPSNMGVH